MSSLGFVRVVRVARRAFTCYDCGRRIEPGERYQSVTASPRYDANPRPGHWFRAPFCISTSEEVLA